MKVAQDVDVIGRQVPLHVVHGRLVGAANVHVAVLQCH